MIRMLSFATLFAFSAVVAEGAELKKFVVRCVEKAEATPDDLFLEFEVDGKPVVFGNDKQAGTSRDKTIAMKDGDSFALEPATLDALKFQQTLVIRIKDKDITRDEPIGEMKLAPGDVTSTYVTKGRDVGSYEYQVDYTTKP